MTQAPLSLCCTIALLTSLACGSVLAFSQERLGATVAMANQPGALVRVLELKNARLPRSYPGFKRARPNHDDPASAFRSHRKSRVNS